MSQQMVPAHDAMRGRFALAAVLCGILVVFVGALGVIVLVMKQPSAYFEGQYAGRLIGDLVWVRDTREGEDWVGLPVRQNTISKLFSREFNRAKITRVGLAAPWLLIEGANADGEFAIVLRVDTGAWEVTSTTAAGEKRAAELAGAKVPFVYSRFDELEPARVFPSAW